MVLRKERPTMQMVLTFLGVVYFGLSADRQVLMAVVALVPIFAQSMTGSWALMQAEKEVSLTVKPVKGIVAVMLAAVAALSMHSLSKLVIENDYHVTYPAKAMDYISENKIDGKLFHHFAQGGYIAHRGYKTWMDGRLDLFGDDFSIGVTNAMAGKSGWREYLDAYKPDLFILKQDAPLINLLQMERNCIKIYSDNNHSIIQCKYIS
jgi:hypothetical protein